jgi:hypothetical protein
VFAKRQSAIGNRQLAMPAWCVFAKRQSAIGNRQLAMPAWCVFAKRQSAIGNCQLAMLRDASFLARKIVKLIDCFRVFSFAFSSLVV